MVNLVKPGLVAALAAAVVLLSLWTFAQVLPSVDAGEGDAGQQDAGVVTAPGGGARTAPASR